MEVGQGTTSLHRHALWSDSLVMSSHTHRTHWELLQPVRWHWKITVITSTMLTNNVVTISTTVWHRGFIIHITTSSSCFQAIFPSKQSGYEVMYSLAIRQCAELHCWFSYAGISSTFVGWQRAFDWSTSSCATPWCSMLVASGRSFSILSSDRGFTTSQCSKTSLIWSELVVVFIEEGGSLQYLS